MSGPDALDQVARGLERFLQVFLGGVAVAILVIAVVMMASMKTGAGSQGGRYYVAAAAALLLGAVDTQFGRLMRHRLPLGLIDTPEYRRYRIGSLLLLFLATLALFGLALLLP